jgi:hypothetical protein
MSPFSNVAMPHSLVVKNMASDFAIAKVVGGAQPQIAPPPG